MKRHTWLLVFLLGINLLSGQDCSQILSGRVIDFHDGVPLEGATITFDNRTIMTDNKGSYSIDGLCRISYAFTISHKDCNSQVVTLDLAKISSKDFYLEHHLNELEEVNVNESKTKTSSSQEETIDKNIIERYSNASLGDALKEITGVSSLNTGSTIVKPIIQGLNGSRVLIMNNGVRMQDMEWGDEHAPNVDINVANNITVVKGASALKYGGDAIGGVIIMESNRAPAKDTLFGKTVLSGGTNGRGGSLTSKLTKAYESGMFLKVQGTLKRFGDVEAPDYVLSNTAIFEKGFSASFGVNKFTHGWDVFYSFYANELGVLASSHIGNVDRLIASINSGEPDIIRDFTYDIENPKQEVTHHLGKIKYFKRFEQLGKWTTQYDFQLNNRLEFDIRRTEERNKIPSIDLELTTHSITSDFEFDSSEKYKFTAGALFRYQENFANPLTGVRRLIPDYKKYDAGAFLTVAYDLKEDLIVDAGIRYDFNQIDAQKFYLISRWEERNYDQDFSDIVIDRNVAGSQFLTNPVFDYHNVSGTAGIQYIFNDDYEFRFNYALSQRAPNPSELFSDGLHHSAARIELGDLRIDQETSHKISLSLKDSHEKWGWEVAPYANFIQDYILLEPIGTELTIRGAFPVWQYRQTNVRLLGVDARAYANWHTNWTTDHKFSLVKGQETDDKQALINMPAPNFNNKITFTKTEWYDFTASLESQYHFRQNEFPPNITVFSPDSGQDVLLEINTPPSAYHLLNFNTGMKFKMGDKSSLNLGFTINNLANTTYRNYLNRQRYYADDLGRNFLLRISINY